MSHSDHIRKIKLFIKVSIVVVITILFIVLGFFVKPTKSFENASLQKWTELSEKQKIKTLTNVIGDFENQKLIIDCVDTIATLENSDKEIEKPIIKTAVIFCYGGDIQNANTDEKQN